MNRSIEIIVSPAGDITINAVGFQGADCEKATKALEEALGAVSDRTRKPEYYTRRNTRNQQMIGG